MQRNLILAVVLSSLVYIGWYSYLGKNLKPPAAGAQTAAAGAVTPGSPAPLAAGAAAPAPASSAALPAADWKKSAAAISAGKAAYLFYPDAASIKSVIYQGPVAPIELIPDAGQGFFASSLPYRFRLKARTAGSLEFSADGPGGLTVTKKFVLSADGGINSFSMDITNKGRTPQILPAWELTVGPGLGTAKSEEKENPKLWRAAYAFMETGRKHPTVKVLKDEPAQNDCVWAGVDNRYFLAALAGGNLDKTRPLRREEKVGTNKAPLLAVPFAAEQLNPGESRRWATSFYLGPKDYQRLQKLGMGLDRSVDFGFFSPLAKLANSALTYFFRLTGNFGAAIVILSVLIQLLLTPLSFKSYKAMAVMKKIQPEMQEIQKRYKDDPKRMNQEVMDLYKRHGTNPLGGCLPMLLQIPVFFALFTALRNSWTLHGAPFIFWIKDLSAKDPFYVLPLVMGGIMFLQQHLSPQTADPAQAAMMKWMPLIFTFMFLSFPSGLVMYWLINSIWGFAQNMYLKNKMA